MAERRDFLNRKKNPFFTHAEVELFLARRNGKVVGRIAAIDDALWNQFHNTETGFFGMFDAPERPGDGRSAARRGGGSSPAPGA